MLPSRIHTALLTQMYDGRHFKTMPCAHQAAAPSHSCQRLCKLVAKVLSTHTDPRDPPERRHTGWAGPSKRQRPSSCTKLCSPMVSAASGGFFLFSSWSPTSRASSAGTRTSGRNDQFAGPPVPLRLFFNRLTTAFLFVLLFVRFVPFKASSLSRLPKAGRTYLRPEQARRRRERASTV